MTKGAWDSEAMGAVAKDPPNTKCSPSPAAVNDHSDNHVRDSVTVRMGRL